MDHYLRYDYDQRLSPGAPPDFIGPFPDAGLAEWFRSIHGPADAKVVQESTPPDAKHTLTPGQMLDEQLKRY